MIVKMLKYSFLVYHREYDGFLERLRELGVLHVIERQGVVSEGAQQRVEQVKAVSDTIKQLEGRLPGKPQPHPELTSLGVLSQAHSLQSQAEQLQQQLATIRKEEALAAPWGEFSPQTIQGLREQGVVLKFFSISTRSFNPAWAQQYPIEVVAEAKGSTHFVMFSTDPQAAVEIDVEEVRIPEQPASQLQLLATQLETELEGINTALAKLATEGLEVLKSHRNELLQAIDYQKVVQNTRAEADGTVRLLEGWVPLQRKPELEQALDGQGVVYFEQETNDNDKIPILLRNNKFAQKFEVIGKLYTLPRYGELDLTPFFAPFYMIFFGFCLGDAGYGILLTLLALIIRGRVAPEMRGVMSLAFYMGLSTIFFGLIGGTFFGINLYATGLPVYSTLAAEFKARDTDITMLLFYLSLVLGGIQILFGQAIRAVNETIQRGWKPTMGTYGWLILLYGMASIGVVSTIQGGGMEPFMVPIYALLAVSGLLIFPLRNLSNNPLANIGAGIWDAYNMATGLLGDLLSYIRLFALGIASGILGFVFNSLAMSVSEGIPVIGILFMVIVLLLGHGINLFMSGLAAFVHPLRLTFVEFYKNAGFTGGGQPYSPFKKIV